MKKIELLDCTLRDGGFVNKWHFGEDCILNIFERLELAGIDIIEIGYLRDYVPFNMDETQFPDASSVGRVLPRKSNEKTRVVAIIDYGDCAQEHIAPCSETALDGIRVTFKRQQLTEAIEFCRELKEKGYFISLQPVSFMDYTPQDVLDLVEAANDLMPYAVCIVDTYGFMNKRDLLRYFSLMDATLHADITLGYHSHNNFQLSFSNAVELVEQMTDRDMIVDCSIMGMGKGAGNAATELMAMYLNNSFSGEYDVSQLLEIADTYIEKEKRKNPWGYSLKYYIAASNYCHHQYVSYLLDKKTLSIKSINEILSSIVPEKKTKYDEEYIHELYLSYQEACVDDKESYERLKNTIGEKTVLLLAPGSSLLEEKEKIEDYIKANAPYVISVNHVSELFRADAVFVSNHKRYSQIDLRVQKYSTQLDVIATSNINPTTLQVGYVLNYSSLLVDEAEVADNAMLLLINALIRMGQSKVVLAGFDGYSESGANYFSKDWDFDGRCWEQNQIINNVLHRMKKQIEMVFLTKSLYE